MSAADRSVVVALSGGVDSAVAALLAVRSGTARAAFTLRLSDDETGPVDTGRCCAPSDVRDARRVAASLGLPHYVVDLRERFHDEVIAPFVAEYVAGRTPIPCVACNDRLKFADLLDRARAVGADEVVTGHYARLVRDGERVRLLRGLDRDKDQSYFLHGLTQEQLRGARFPLGELRKSETRALAREARLAVSDKPESQEICFIPDGDTAGFVERHAESPPKPGPIRDLAGREIGRHQGIHRYTVGQRKGLGAHGQPTYALELDVAQATIVAGPAAALAVTECRVERFNWIAGRPPAVPFDAEVQVRHARRAVPARFVPEPEGCVTIRFAEPHRGVSPGQAAVAYEGDEVLGGGPIDGTVRQPRGDET